MNPSLTVGAPPNRILFAFLLAFLTGCRESESASQIVIGHTMPADSASERQAIRLELDRLNADSPIPGLRWGAVHADAGHNPEQNLAQANRLTAVNRVHVLIGGMSSAHADRLGQVASSEPILAMTLAESLMSPTQTWQFCLGISPADRGRALARLARDELRFNRIAVVRSSEEAPSKCLEAFRAELILGKGAMTEVVVSKDKGIDDIAATVRASACDGVFVAVADPAAALRVLKALKVAESIPVLFGEDELARQALSDGGLGKSPVFAVSAWGDDETHLTESARLWRKGWIEKYQQPPDAAAVLVTDAVRVLAQAIGKTGTFAPYRVKDELLKPGQTWTGVAGPLRFDGGQACHRTAFVLRWDGSAWKTHSRLEAAQE